MNIFEKFKEHLAFSFIIYLPIYPLGQIGWRTPPKPLKILIIDYPIITFFYSSIYF